MDGRMKSMREAYKSETKQAGIFRVTNTVTNKVFLGSTLNLHGPLNRLQFELQQGMSRISGLQEDYRRYGQDAFIFEVVEVIEPGKDPKVSLERELEKVEQRYAEALDRGNTYNQAESIRFLKVRNPARI
jgi:hypothetical protein